MQPDLDLKKLIVKCFETLSSGDITYFEGHLSRQDAVVAIGTDAHEWWTGYDAILNVFKSEMENLAGVSLVTGDPQAYSDGNVGWVVDKSKFKLPDGKEVPFRLTCVFRKEDDAWKMVLWHASVGVPNEELFIDKYTAQ